MSKRAVETAEEPAGADAVARKRRRGDPQCARFDMNVRNLWETLDDVGYEAKEAGLVFVTSGVVDLIVHYARPFLPLFARLPGRIGGEANIGPGPSALQHGMGSVLRASMMNNDQALAGLFPVGTTLSCLNPLHYDRRADVVVVVPPDDRVGCKLGSSSQVEGELYVGVIVPVTNAAGTRFGADRTIFFEHWSPTEGRFVADPESASASEDGAWAEPPAEGYYAVHYVNVLSRNAAYTNPATNRYGFGRPYQANSSTDSFPNAAHSKLSVHALPGEVERDVLEARLLDGIRRQRLATEWDQWLHRRS